MNATPDFDRHASSWLAEGPTELSDRVLGAALREVHLTQQRRRWPAFWRTAQMPIRFGFATLIAIVAVAGIIAFNQRPGGVGTLPTPGPTSEASVAQTGPTVAPTLPQAPDTASWVGYTSEQYLIDISHPAGWTVVPATRDWTFGDDADLDPESPAMDSFVAPDRSVRVSLWAIPGETLPGGPGEVIEPLENINAWAEAFCRATDNAPCDGVAERALPMCLEYRDCHPATMVLYDDDVQAYFSGGGEGDLMVAVVVWRNDSDPSTLAFGSSRQLLQAFLSTINGGGNAAVWPMGYLPGLLSVLVTQPPSTP